MAAIVIGIFAVIIKLRIFHLYKKLASSPKRDTLIMQIVVLIMCAVMLPFVAVYIFSIS
ncbi:MAG: hypothetical protein V4642_07940 [Bacteroidota bacterium]